MHKNSFLATVLVSLLAAYGLAMPVHAGPKDAATAINAPGLPVTRVTLSPEEIEASVGQLAALVSAKNAGAQMRSILDRIAQPMAQIIRRDVVLEPGGTDHSKTYLSFNWGYQDAAGDEPNGAIDAVRRAYLLLGDSRSEVEWRRLLVLHSAKFGSMATDFAGVYWIYSMLLGVKYEDADTFEHALDLIVSNGELGCLQSGNALPPKACVLSIGATVFREFLSLYAAADMQRSAIDLMRATRGLPATELASQYLVLADLEWRLGTASVVEDILAQLVALAREDAAVERRFAFDIAKWRTVIANARLDDDATYRGLIALFDALPDIKGKSYEDGEADKYTQVLDLVNRFAFADFCKGCRDDIWRRAAGLAEAALSMSQMPFSMDRDLYLLSLASPEDYFPDDLKDRLRSALARRLSESTATEFFKTAARFAPAGSDAHGIGLLVALTDYSGVDGTVGVSNEIIMPVLKMLVARNLREAMVANDVLQQLLELAFEQFGADTSFYEFTRDYAARLRRFGREHGERVVLELGWRRFAGPDDRYVNQQTVATRATGAALMLPIVARLAEFRLASGDTRGADYFLNHAQAFAHAKITREWRPGSDRATSALRNLAPALQTIADLRMRRAAAEPSPERLDAAFQALQFAMFTDTAATLQLAIRRRAEGKDLSARLFKTRDTAANEVERLSQLRANVWLRPTTGIDGELTRLSKEADRADREIATRFPGRDVLRDIAPIPLVDVHRSLRPGEGLMVLHAEANQLQAMLLASNGVTTAWQIPLSVTHLSVAVAQVRSGVTLTPGGFPVFPISLAHQLYRDIFSPVERIVADLDRLLVIADGPLQSLPLGILPTRDMGHRTVAPGDMARLKIPWLARRTGVAQLPSVRTFVDQRRAPSGRTDRLAFLGVGDPVLAPEAPQSRRVDFAEAFGPGELADPEALRSLASLPETADELRSIAAALGDSGSTLLLAADATETAVKSSDLARYRVISFATHGLLAGAMSANSEPGLVLTPPQIADARDDGLLTTSEIMQLQLDAELVILSACDTATSDGRPRADGLSGLARAFFAAGARNLVLTHWSIPSRPAVALTTRMVEEKKAVPAASWTDALRRSVISMMDDNANPDFAQPASWGAFQVIGSE